VDASSDTTLTLFKYKIIGTQQINEGPGQIRLAFKVRGRGPYERSVGHMRSCSCAC
jgi:hypothetical protein